jgi:hypothetical protein
MEYDVFISYAHEDKPVVDQLVPLLQEKRLKVWYAPLELRIGNDIAEKINQGLLKSRYGVVILSKTFLEKKRWTRTELNALLNRQATGGKKVILPVLHNLSAEELARYSSLLAGIYSARTSDGLNSVAEQIVAVCNEPELPEQTAIFKNSSGQIGLKEQCFSIIRQGDKIAWRKLISDITEPIPEQLKKWKQDKGDMAAQKGGKEWEDALLEAANICLPGFVPIFATVETGKNEYWRASLGIVRRLAILRHEMGGGSVWSLDIGNHMLYVVGSLGMSIAASPERLDFINEWMMLKIPDESGNGEKLWIKVRYGHRLPEGLRWDIKEPFKFLSSVCESDLIKGFFYNRERLTENLLMANLIASMIEFRMCCEDSDCIKALRTQQQIIFDIQPLWCLTKPHEFRALTLDLFGDSEGVINFVFPQRSAISARCWEYWQYWHKACIRVWSQTAFQTGRYDLFDARFLRLPGQPDLKGA